MLRIKLTADTERTFTYRQAENIRTSIDIYRLFKSSYNFYDDGGIYQPEEAQVKAIKVEPRNRWDRLLQKEPIDYVLEISEMDRVTRVAKKESEAIELYDKIERLRKNYIKRRKNCRKEMATKEKLKSVGIELSFWAVGLSGGKNTYTPEEFEGIEAYSHVAYCHREDENEKLWCWLILPETTEVIETNRPGMISRRMTVQTSNAPCNRVGPFESKEHLVEWLLDKRKGN